LQPEVLDAIFIVPAGLGLALFGHALGYDWDNESLQHVFLGILSIIGALLSAWLSKASSDGHRKRNIFPGLVAIIAGYTFLAHPAKHISLLGELHKGLGVLVSGIGVTRILDVVFVVYRGGDSSGYSRTVSGPWNFLGSYAGISAGLFIMTANDELTVGLVEMGVHAASVFMGLLALSMTVLGCK
jgi:hypothetical protein